MDNKWSVSIEVNGRDILNLSSEGYSGIENIDQYADIVRLCADHLLAFIGPKTEDDDLIVQVEKDFSDGNFISGDNLRGRK